jgi:hypothetical protein
MVDEHVSRRADRTAHLWALLMLELWFRESAVAVGADQAAG